MLRFRYGPPLPRPLPLKVGDGLILVGLAAFLFVGARLAVHAPAVMKGPEISLGFGALPWYSLLSTARMFAAYVLSLAFSLGYGYLAARSRTAEKVLLPLLDVLQSVPILSFLPVVLLGLTAVLPQKLAVELATVILIFTSQAWNLTFSFYQSVTTVPLELREAASVFRLKGWLRLRTLELPFAALGLVWNSMMSWAGGWFFLMAAEIFHVGARDFRLPGLGSYLQVAANRGDTRAVLAGLGALVAVIVLLDQLVWRPLLAWSDRFKLDTVSTSEPPRSWCFDLMRRSWLLERFGSQVCQKWNERLDQLRAQREATVGPERVDVKSSGRLPKTLTIFAVFLGVAAVYGAFRALWLLAELPLEGWTRIALGTLATFARVSAALLLTLAWTVPVGVAIGTNRRLAEFLQPLVQVVASIPATAAFPVLLLGLLRVPGGLNTVSVLLMLMGTQWYLLFNVIAGAAAIPQDLRDTTDMLRLSRWQRWRTLLLPALFPYLITGSITASGGAWNASIVAEHVEFAGETHATVGVGALVASATGEANYPLLVGATGALVMTVVLINRRVWRRLYCVAEERYRME
jgi:NitT/TauT family transport system permease protein